MKRLITAVMIAIIAVLSFTGCGMVQNAADDAGEMVTDASVAASEAASAMDDDGQVDDDDGIIDNDDKENND